MVGWEETDRVSQTMGRGKKDSEREARWKGKE